jgi:hypothetical protein
MALYQFVQNDPKLGMLSALWDPEKVDVLAAAELRGWTYTGPCTRPSLREELQGQPVFAELCGPMWGGIRDGVAVIRYESAAAYDRLSA